MSAGRKLGKYEIQGAIGKGEQAMVYRGLDTGTQAPVAIKVLRAASVPPGAAQAFGRRVPELARLRHPGIAGLVDLMDLDDKLVLVWQLAQGKTLAALLASGATPHPKVAWNIARQMLEALAHAHSGGFVHGDLRPGNVTVDAAGRVVLTDFGIASLLTSRGEAVEYSSPEHLAGGPLTARSDIYQAAAIAYRMVAGKLPFNGSAEEIRRAVAQERPIDPSAHDNHLAWQLDFVLQKALAKAPEDRYAVAADFAEGLRLGLQDTIGRGLVPAHAQPPPAASPVKSALLHNAGLLAPKPAARAPAPAAPTAAAAAAAPAKPGVLLVDDDERILNALRTLLRRDYAVQTAPGGEEALAILQRGGIDVIVSDQRMPGMSGVELLRKARALAPGAARILLTGYTDLASLVGSINQGEIFRFVMKPWDNDDLRKALAEAASAAAARAAAPASTAPAAPRSAGSLLVVDRGEGVARGLERLLAGAAKVIRVDSAADAARVLAREEVAAVVADGDTGMPALVALFRELHAKRPGVRSILLTQEPDAEVAIELINNAHIFRLLPKPVSARELRTQVAEALRRYASSKQARA
jgi:eukaryotic-like serine/threonine-protein kinase